MKKFTVISLAALLVLAFGATAYAQVKLDFRASGSVDAQTHWSVNVPPLNPAGNPIYGVGGAATAYRIKGVGGALDKEAAYWDSRFSLRFDAVMGKELSGTLQFEIDAGRWGNRPTGIVGNLRDANNAGYWSTDRSAVEVKYMYFDVALPYFGIPVPMTVRAGGQPFAIRPWFFQATDGFGISGGIKIDPVTINPLYFKPSEGALDWAADDTDVWGLQANAKLGTFTVGGYGLYYNMGSYPMWVASSVTDPDAGLPINGLSSIFPQNPGPFEADFWWIGLYADGKAGPVNIQFDAAYDHGKVKGQGFSSVKYNGWAARGKITYPWEKFEFGFTGLYASGSDANKTSATGLPGSATATGVPSSKVSGWMVPVGSENGAANGESVVIYGMEAGASGGNGWAVNHNYNQMSKGALGGTWFAKLMGSYKVTPWYKVTLQGLYIGDTTKHGNTFGNALKSNGRLRDDSTIGVELDLLNEFAIYKNLTFKVFGGYLFAGEAMNMNTAGDPNLNMRNPWAIRTRLLYSF
jgi:hypothetical protein